MKIPKKMLSLDEVASHEDLKSLEEKVAGVSVISLPLVGENIENSTGSTYVYKRNEKCYIGAKISNTESYSVNDILAKLSEEYRPTIKTFSTDRYLTAYGFNSDGSAYKGNIVLKVNNAGEISIYGMASSEPINMIVIPEQGFLI